MGKDSSIWTLLEATLIFLVGRPRLHDANDVRTGSIDRRRHSRVICIDGAGRRRSKGLISSEARGGINRASRNLSQFRCCQVIRRSTNSGGGDLILEENARASPARIGANKGRRALILFHGLILRARLSSRHQASGDRRPQNILIDLVSLPRSEVATENLGHLY
jgi:hypothetical protein